MGHKYDGVHRAREIDAAHRALEDVEALVKAVRGYEEICSRRGCDLCIALAPFKEKP